ncbi:MAG: glycosyltransferase [Actinomycetota bacterium]
MLGWRRHEMRLLLREGGGEVDLRSERGATPTGSCLMALTVRSGGRAGGLRLSCRRAGERGTVLAHEFDVPPAETRLEHLVAIPRDATGLSLEAAGDGAAQVARVTIVEMSPPVLTALLSARWLGWQLRQPRRLGEKVANLVRAIRHEGLRGAVAGVVASQTARQGGAAPPPRASPPDPGTALLPWELRPHLPPATTKEAFDRHRRRDLEAFLRSGDTLETPSAREPVVSIVVVTFNRAELALHCLRSVADHAEVPAEVIVVDNASTDETGVLLDRLRGATVLRNPGNAGFVEGCNQGVERARGRHVLLLNSDAFLLPGSLEEAVATVESDPGVGVVGGPIVALNGRLQEAGSILWADGRAQGYGRGDDPGKPEYRFRRDVDFVSGAFLLTRRELWRKLGGFDQAYAPAYYEDADYCLRARDAGFRVVYEPLAGVVHYEYGSSAGPAAEEAMAANRRAFVSRHGAGLAGRPGGRDGVLVARAAEPRERVLVVDDRVPLAVMGSGAPRMAAILRGVVELGREVTFFPGLPFAGTWEEVYAEVPREVEVMLGWDRTHLGRFLDERRGHYGHIIVSRSHNMAIVRDLLGRDPGLLGSANLVYDAEAIGAMRTVRQLEGRGLDPVKARRLIDAEVKIAAAAHRVASVSEGEAEAFRGAGLGEVHLLPHAVDLRPTPRPFAERRHLFFVGRLAEDLSPNVDGLRWFLQEVWPAIRDELAPEGAPELLVAGRASPTVSALRAPGLRLLGAAPDLTPLYDGARAFVAPLRFSAGIPLKILEAASYGVPVVTTDLLASQLGWTGGVELLSSPVGDAEAFARHCVAVCRDRALWSSLRQAALGRVAATASMERFREALEDLLAPPSR